MKKDVPLAFTGAYGTDRVTDFSADGKVFSFTIDWLAAGCPERFGLALGDRVAKIVVPDGFPDTPIKHEEKAFEVYERKQSFVVTSAPSQSVRSVRLTLDLSGVDVPTTFWCQDKPYTDFDAPIGGPIIGWKPGGILSNPDGSVKWYIQNRVLEGLEKHIASGGACRPNGRTYSILTSQWESPKKVIDTEIEPHPDGVSVLVTETLEWTVLKNWVNYECQNGVWTRTGGASDRIVRQTKITKRYF